MNDISQELEWAERDLKFAEKTAIEAHERLTQAEQRVTEQHRRVQLAKRAVAAATPVDRTKRTLTDGSPVTEDHRELKPNGQQKDYVVLSADERCKGFVRPVRRSYIHTKCGQPTSMSQSIAETYARDPYFYSGTFCCSCGAHFPTGESGEFVWQDNPTEKVGT
jgi:hypothetical protein